ncbi:hypothetical protein GE061_003534 [Apolygus lucorum]|uniref:Uncharacterized protein n=1 Tax=Apolygus lucorum TaxID=248454 RepID=A0A8S9X3T9_APOLU|nr:hypothetical protein GE061_003534 [Apolygus lucorum]
MYFSRAGLDVMKMNLIQPSFTASFVALTCAKPVPRYHATRTLAPHKRVPLSEKPQELPKCQVHTSHTAEFVCLKTSVGRSPSVTCARSMDATRIILTH